jgi:hypothetical protein
MKSRQPTDACLPFGLIDRTSPTLEPCRIEVFQNKQSFIAAYLDSETLGNPGKARPNPITLLTIPMRFHLIGLELPPVGQIRIPSSWMLPIPGLHMLDDYARRLRSFQAYAVNAPVSTPQALHHPKVLQPLRLGQLQNKPIDFLVLHDQNQRAEVLFSVTCLNVL